MMPWDSHVNNSLSSRTVKGLSVALLLLVCFGVYYNSLLNGFVSDDIDQVVTNPWIRDFSHIDCFFREDVWKISGMDGGFKCNYYRPLMYVFYAFDYDIFGLSPLGYHLTSLFFHSGVTVLVFVLVLKFLEKYRPATNHILPALTAAILFAVHPIHTESVAWIADITDLTCAFFYLLSFIFYLESGSSRRLLYITISTLLFFIATLCKETALTLLLLIPAYDFHVRKDEGPFGVGKNNLEYMWSYGPFVMAAAVYFMMRLDAMGGFAPARWHQDLNAYSFVLSDFQLFSSYLFYVTHPVHLTYYHVFHPVASISENKEVLSLITTAGFVVVALLLSKKNRLVFFGFLLFFVPLVPTFYIYGLPDNVFAERYLYIPSIGFVFVIAVLVADRPKNRMLFAGVMAALTILALTFSLITISRNRVYKDNFTLFEETARESPDGVMPHYNYGLELAKKGRVDEAMEQFKEAVDLEPRDFESHKALAMAEEKKGLLPQAISEYETALALNPRYAEGHVDLGTLFLKMRMVDEAIDELKTAVALNPEMVRANNNLAVAYDQKGFTAEAIKMYERSLEVDSGCLLAHYNLAVDYYREKRMDDAALEFKKVIRLKPDLMEARAMLDTIMNLKPHRQHRN